MKFEIVKKDTQSTPSSAPWFQTQTINKHKIRFDTNTHLTGRDFMSAIQNDTDSIHVIVPILPEAYDFYKKFIQGNQRKNVVYIQDALRRVPPGKKYMVHYVFLGEDFWTMKMSKVQEEEKELMLKHKEAQDKLLSNDMQRMVYPDKYRHYEYQPDVVKYEMEYFPHDTHDIIKLLGKIQHCDVVLRQYDLPGRDFIADLKTHLCL